MTALVVGRLWQAALVLGVMSLAVYGLIGFMPGDPIDLMVSSDPDLTPEDAIRLKALHGLDRPVLERWWAWAAHAARGDLGYSRLYAAPVLDVLGPALANTLVLLGTSFVLALSIALPAGTLAAMRPFSWYDRIINFVALAGVSVPVFWFALVLIVVFAVELGVLPAGGRATSRPAAPRSAASTSSSFPSRPSSSRPSADTFASCGRRSSRPSGSTTSAPPTPRGRGPGGWSSGMPFATR